MKNTDMIMGILAIRHSEVPFVNLDNITLLTRNGGAAELTVKDLRTNGFNAFSFRVNGGMYEIMVMCKMGS